MFDIGSTDPETLYDFCCSLSLTTYACIDPKSDLYKAFMEVYNSAWDQLPKTVLIDLRDPDMIPADHPPITFVWDEKKRRYM